MSKLTILHLSDLHYSKSKETNATKLVDALLADIRFLKEKKGISPDVVFFTGDLVWSGDEGDSAFQWISGKVVDPVLDLLGLTQEQFFHVPGNHEVARSKVYQETETGLAGLFNTPEAFEKYYAEFSIGDDRFKTVTGRLEGYQKFSEAYRQENTVNRDFFYSTHKLKINGVEVGIACFNSAWRCSHFGEPVSDEFGADYKRLIVGRSIIEKAGQDITGSDITIALCHHPFDWLVGWDERQVRRRMPRNFNLLFNGHIHESDMTHFEQSFGGFFTSTSGALRSGEDFSHYSIVEVDLSEKSVSGRLRKWYPGRGEFDQETAKARKGIVKFEGFSTNNPEVERRLMLNKYRQELGGAIEDTGIVNPLEGIVELSLRDVYVDPMICASSSLRRMAEEPEILDLDELLGSGENLFFYGRSESGKTSLLRHIQTKLLEDSEGFETVIPVFVKFSDVNPYKPEKIVGAICDGLVNTVTKSDVSRLLGEGVIRVLIDDLGGSSVDRVSERINSLVKFLESYPKVLIVATLDDHLNQNLQRDVEVFGSAISANRSFIWPFTTAKIRQLLTRVSVAKSVDVNSMLEQILFYFQQLQIPATPLAATLFIGVLFRDPNQKNIQNEAYLIENYLEDILEKIQPDGRSSDLDFRDKESFLAHVAWEMVVNDVTSFSVVDFDKIKSSYFTGFGEEVPHDGVFDAFYERGILRRSEGLVSFKVSFWFSFFIAKAMEKDRDKLNALLDRDDYLKFGTAIAYKAGLTRNDKVLLSEVRGRLEKLRSAALDEALLDADTRIFEDGLKAAGNRIIQSIDSKVGTVKDFDKNADNRLLISESTETVSDDLETDIDQLGELLTLHADILRNTREVGEDVKMDHLGASVSGFLDLMWVSLAGVDMLVKEVDDGNLEKLFFSKMRGQKTDERIKALRAASQKMVFQLIPVSFALFMSDHLGSPKLKGILAKLANDADRVAERLYFVLILIKSDFKAGIRALENLTKDTSVGPADFISSIFLRVHSFETILSDEEIQVATKALDDIRKKSASQIRNLPPFVQDTFRDDTRKIIHVKQDKNKKK
ncbi:MAG: metallophosphoesterase [Verrucomicrobiaceae bacterium]